MTSNLIAALPMYDWPERRDEVDAEWATLRDGMRAQGINAPDTLTRRNADMPGVPGGIRDAQGAQIGPDPATLAEDEFDLPTLWRHPSLLLAQTCWGPMQLGLEAFVSVVGQPDYSAVEGGAGPLYSSVIVMRRQDVSGVSHCPSPVQGTASLPIDLLRGRAFAFNSTDSMSGYLGISGDLAGIGESLSLFGALVETGGHRLSLQSVASGRADVAAVDACSWDIAKHYEPAAARLTVVGWTSRSRGLPFIRAKDLDIL